MLEAGSVDRNSDYDNTAVSFPVVRYSYQVDGKSYIGKRLSFGVGGGSFVLWALRGLVPGGPVRVFYDPAKPFHSVLRPGPAPTAVILIVAGTLIALAAIVHGPLQPNPG